MLQLSQRVPIPLCDGGNLSFQVAVAVNINLPSRNRGQFILHLCLCAVADGHNQNNRGDADDDSKHCEKGTPAVHPDIGKGHFHIFPKLSHPVIPPSVSPAHPL